MFDKISFPFFTTATLVSSQLDSKAKMGFEEGKFLKNYYTETLEDAIEMYVYL